MGQRLDSSSLPPALAQAFRASRVQLAGGVPVRSHAHSHGGISTLLQSARHVPGGRMEARIDGSDCAMLLVRTGTAMAAETRLAGEPLRASFATGEGSFLLPGIDSWWSVEPDHARGWFQISFSRSFLATVTGSQHMPIAPIPHVADPTVSALARMFFDLTESAEPPEPLLWQSLGHVLLWRLLLLGSGGVNDIGASPPRGGLAPWQAKRTTQYIAENLERRVTLDELAALARLSPFHFARAFARTVGMPPYRYQRKLRMERACELLARGEMRIIDVALAVGYESPQALARVFNAEHGMTPSEWRRQHAGTD